MFLPWQVAGIQETRPNHTHIFRASGGSLLLTVHWQAQISGWKLLIYFFHRGREQGTEYLLKDNMVYPVTQYPFPCSTHTRPDLSPLLLSLPFLVPLSVFRWSNRNPKALVSQALATALHTATPHPKLQGLGWSGGMPPPNLPPESGHSRQSPVTYIWKEVMGIGDYLVGYPGALTEFGRRRGCEFLGTDPHWGSTGGYLTPDFAPQPQLLSMVHVHRLTPTPALMFTTAMALILVISGNFNTIVNFLRQVRLTPQAEYLMAPMYTHSQICTHIYSYVHAHFQNCISTLHAHTHTHIHTQKHMYTLLEAQAQNACTHTHAHTHTVLTILSQLSFQN